MRSLSAHLVVAGLVIGAAGLTITTVWLVVIGAVALTAAAVPALLGVAGRHRR